MDPHSLLATDFTWHVMERQFQSAEWQHRATALALREPWHVRFTRWVRRLRLLATEQAPATRVVQQETC